MNRTLTFILLVLLGTLMFSISHIFNPYFGWIFLIEEFLALLMLLLGYFIFRKKIEQIVTGLNKQLPWRKSFIKRLPKELGIICLYAGCTFMILFSILWGIQKIHGTPKYLIEKHKIRMDVEAQKQARIKPPPLPPVGRPSPKHRPPPPPPHLKPIEHVSLLDMKWSLLKLSFGMFGLLFFIEEAFQIANKQQETALQEEQLAKEQALSKASALQNQLNPHFMFNSLNVLSGLIHEDLDKSDAFIKKLSEVYRYVLDQSEEVVSSVEKELEFIENYVYLQKIRFENKLQVTYNVSESKFDYLVPSLTLELLVENAIKHNIIASNKVLSIDIYTEGNYLFVSNNFQERTDKEVSHEIGLKNLKERLNILGLKGAKFGVKGDNYLAKIPLLKPE